MIHFNRQRLTSSTYELFSNVSSPSIYMNYVSPDIKQKQPINQMYEMMGAYFTRGYLQLRSYERIDILDLLLNKYNLTISDSFPTCSLYNSVALDFMNT
jgi:hypothetical protein